MNQMNMKKRLMTLPVVVCILLMPVLVQADVNTPSGVELSCAIGGGTYLPPGVTGGYGCIYPDGSMVYCYANKCETIPPGRTEQPTSFKSAVWAGLWKSLVIEKEVVDVNNKVETLLAGMNFLLQQVGGESKPDLVPLPLADVAGEAAFCRLSSDGKRLQVLIHNQGGGPAVASTTRVEFQTGSTTIIEMLPTSALSGSSPTTLVEFDRPAGCTGVGGVASCDFQISVDVNGEVAESNDENNDVVGRCYPSFQ